MLTPSESILVNQIAGNRAVITASYTSESLLLSLGFTKDGDTYSRSISDHLDRQALIRDLIRADALFMGGADWSPAEVVEYYRDQKAVVGPYKRIVWRSPDRYEVSLS